MRRIISGCIIIFSIILILGCSTDCPECEDDPTPGPDSDTDAPVVAFVNPGEGELVSGTLLIAGTAIDTSDIDSIEIRIDTGGWVPLSDPDHYWTYTIDTFQLTETIHSATVRTEDENGNQSSEVTVNFEVDWTVPEISITSPSHGEILRGDDLIEGTATDSNGIKSVLINHDEGTEFIDTGETSPWDYLFDTTTAPDGELIITALANDNAGMYAITNIAVIVDNTPPAVSITTPVDGATASVSFDFEGTASDSQGIDRIMVKISGGAEDLASGTSDWTYPVDIADLTPEGLHTLSVIAYDTAGNFTEEQIDIYVDQSPPEISFSNPAEDSYHNDPGVTIDGTVINFTTLDTLEIDVADGAGFIATDTITQNGSDVDWDHYLDTAGYSDDQYTITVRAFDIMTNAWDEETLTLYVDNTDPTGTITYPFTDSTVAANTNIIITGSASDAMQRDTAQLTIDGSGPYDVNFTPGTAYWTYTWLSGGSGTVDISLTVTDEAGNDFVITETNITISTDAPSGSIISPQQGDIVGGTIDINGQATDNTAVTAVGYQFDSTGGTWIPANIGSLPDWDADPDFDTTSLTEGLHDLYVRIYDGTNETIIQISVVIDNIAPAISITYPTNANQGDNFLYDEITITGTASDTNLTSVVVDIDTDTYIPVVTGLTNWNSMWNTAAYPAAQEGVLVRATATDEAGNTNSMIVTVDVKPMITSVSVESVFIGEQIILTGYNFVNDANTKVRFTAGAGTIDATPDSVTEYNEITVTVPGSATSGDMYVVEGAGAVESNHVFIHVWEKVDIGSSGNTEEQDIFISEDETYQAIFDGGGTKDLRFSKNAGASVQLDDNGGGGGASVGQQAGITGYYETATLETNVFISYINFQDERLRFIRSLESGDNWQAPSEFTFAINKEATTSIAYDPVNNVIGITYQTLAGTLEYITSTDDDNAPGDTWIATPVIVDSTVGAGFYSHLAYDSAGTPYIAYYDSIAKMLRFAYYTGIFWSIEDVDTADLQGQYVSMTLDSADGIHISYYNGQTGDLMYAYAADTLANFTITTVNSNGITGYCTDIAIDPVTDYPHIAYIDYSYSELKYAYYTGTEWELIPVPDSIANVMIAKVAIAVDSTGNRYIGYGDADGGHRLMYRD